MNEKLYKISEAAKITDTSRQTLIFYDKKGILSPEFIDDNSYRFYSDYQIKLIETINILKNFGFSLNDIKEYLNNRNEDDLITLLTEAELRMSNRIKEIKAQLKVISSKKKQLRDISNAEPGKIYIEKRDVIKVIVGETLPVNQTGDDHMIFGTKFENLLRNNGMPLINRNVIVDKSYLNDKYDNQVSRFCSEFIGKTNLDTEIVQEGLYAIMYHFGSHQTSQNTYHELIKYIEKSEYVIDGDSYERVIINFLFEEDTDKYVSEIAIKIKKS